MGASGVDMFLKCVSMNPLTVEFDDQKPYRGEVSVKVGIKPWREILFALVRLNSEGVVLWLIVTTAGLCGDPDVTSFGHSAVPKYQLKLGIPLLLQTCLGSMMSNRWRHVHLYPLGLTRKRGEQNFSNDWCSSLYQIVLIAYTSSMQSDWRSRCSANSISNPHHHIRYDEH